MWNMWKYGLSGQVNRFKSENELPCQPTFIGGDVLLWHGIGKLYEISLHELSRNWVEGRGLWWWRWCSGVLQMEACRQKSSKNRDESFSSWSLYVFWRRSPCP